MQDDVKKIIYGVIIAFLLVVISWIGFIYISGCGFSLNCSKVAQVPAHTPIPTLIPAQMPAAVLDIEQASGAKCQIFAVDLIGAWVSAGYPENDPFLFTDQTGVECNGEFTKDIQPLFSEGNLWYSGAPACITCHNPNLLEATASMDLSSYAGIVAGSRRVGGIETGNDILGGGDWEASLLYTQLYVKKVMPQGRPPDVPAEGPLLFAGSATQ